MTKVTLLETRNEDRKRERDFPLQGSMEAQALQSQSAPQGHESQRAEEESREACGKGSEGSINTESSKS